MFDCYCTARGQYITGRTDEAELFYGLFLYDLRARSDSLLLLLLLLMTISHKAGHTVMLVHAGLCWRFHSPPNSDMDYGKSLTCVCNVIFFACAYNYIHTGDFGL